MCCSALVETELFLSWEMRHLMFYMVGNTAFSQLVHSAFTEWSDTFQEEELFFRDYNEKTTNVKANL